MFVFKNGSHFSQKTEFMLIIAASLVGVGIQLVVVSLAVEKAKLPAIIGKVCAIAITFFWNFWFRKRFIYPDATPEDIIP
jgi:putative flippase GtrA